MRRVLVALILTGFSLALGPRPSNAGPQVSVTASRLNVRESPGKDARVLGFAERGARLDLLEEEPGWLKVRTPDGTVGWVASAFVERVESPVPALEPSRESKKEPAAPVPSASLREGGSAGRKFLKYGCLAGAAVAAVLAYGERSSGNDSYAEYKDLAKAGDAKAAEVKYDETADHDGKARNYMIVSGVLAGATIAQEFLLGRGSDDRASLQAPVQFAWDIAGRHARASLVLARF